MSVARMNRATTRIEIRGLTISSSAASVARWDEKAGLPNAVGKSAAKMLRARGPEGRPAVKKRSTGNGTEGMGAWTVGMDLGDRTSHICVLDEGGTVVERGKVQTTREGLRKRFEERRRMRIALEVGTHSPWVSRFLKELGHEVLVANPRKTRLIYQSRGKQDPVDAEALARIARLDPKLLYPVEHRAESVAQDLAVLRARDALVRTRTQLVNHVRGAVKATGHRVKKCSTRTFTGQAVGEIPEEVREALSSVVKTIEVVSRQILALDGRIRELGKTKYPETALLRQVGGVGPIVALAYVLTLEHPGRFRKSRAVGPYLGLVPARSQSGDSDPQLRITKEGDAFLRRHESEVGPDGTALPEATRMLQRQHVGQRHDRAHSSYLPQQRGLGVLRFPELPDSPVQRQDLSRHDFDRLHDARQRFAHLLGNLAHRLARERPRRAFLHPVSRRLDRSANVIDELRPRPHQRIARPEDGQVLRDALGPVFHRVEKLRVQPRDPRQRLGIHRVLLPTALVDQPGLPGVGNQHLVSELLQKPTDSRRVRPYLERDPHSPPLLEPLPQAFPSRLDLAPLDNRPSFVEHTDVARPISQIHSHRPRPHPLGPVPGATLLHGRSPFWASSPQHLCSGFSDCVGETGLLIPSRLRSPLTCHPLVTE